MPDAIARRLPCTAWIETVDFVTGDAAHAVAPAAPREAEGTGPWRLPDDVAARLDCFRASLGAAGALLVRGVPVPASLPATPDVPFARSGFGPIGTEGFLLAVAARLGEVIGFSDWHGGATVQNFYPVAELSRTQCASNTVYLEFHTETAFREATPDALALLCLREAPSSTIETLVADFAAIVAGLPSRDRALAAQPRFGFRDPAGKEDQLGPLYPLVRPAARGGVRYDYAEAIRGADSDAARLLERLRDEIHARAVSVVLRRGDALVLDNRHLVHGRQPIEAGFDGRDRWLQRVLVRATRT